MRPWRNDCLRNLMPDDSALDDLLSGHREMPAELHLRLLDIPRERKQPDGEIEVLSMEWSMTAPVFCERHFDSGRVLVMLGTPTTMLGDYERIDVTGSIGQHWTAEQYDWWCREIDESVQGKTYIRWAFALMLVPAAKLDGVLATS